MGTEPVLVTLGPARFGVGQVRAGQAGNENLRLADDILVDDTQRHAGVIDFERLAGAMLPAHRRRPGVSLPGMEMRAELGVAVALRMPAQIFQPQQAQCHAAATQLLLDRLPIRQRTIPMARVNGREQASVKLLLAQLRHGLPVQPDRRGAVEMNASEAGVPDQPMASLLSVKGVSPNCPEARMRAVLTARAGRRARSVGCRG